MNILYFGMTGRFSLPPLAALVADGLNPQAVIIPAPHNGDALSPRLIEPPPPRPSDLPLFDPLLTPNIVHLAWQQHIPVWEVGALSGAATLKLLAALQPDIIVVACFSRIFPPALLTMPRYGCLNLHPSLLPAYRGPEPLFWIARNDERVTGVTLHFLDSGIDSGDIVTQTRFERPDGLSGAELEARCATEGATLLLAALQQLERGEPLPYRPQVASEARYYAWPSQTDLLIPTQWSARRAFNFLRGAEQWPLAVKLGETHFSIHAAISYAEEQKLEQPYFLLGDELWVQFQPGVLRAKVVVDKINQFQNKLAES